VPSTPLILIINKWFEELVSFSSVFVEVVVVAGERVDEKHLSA